MPPGQPGRGTPEGMNAASRPAAGQPGNGAPLTQYRRPRSSPSPAHYRLASQRVKDASGAAKAAGPTARSLSHRAGSHETGHLSGETSREAMPSCPAKARTTKTEAKTPLDTGPLL